MLNSVLFGDTGAETEGFILPYEVKLIGEYAFCGIAVKSVVISPGISVIPTGMFQSCEKLESVSLPDTVTTIGDYAFDSCEVMKAELPASITKIGKRAFNRCRTLDDNALKNCKNLTVLEEHAFYQCSGLSNVTLPSTLIRSTNAFFGCGLDTLVFECNLTADISIAVECKTIVYKGAVERSLYFGIERTDIYTTSLPESDKAIVIVSAAVINFAGTREEFKAAGYVWDERYTVCSFEVDLSQSE
jgi:hypothetical protein